MPGLLPPVALLVAFVAASFVLAVTPGPGVLYIVTRSLAQGHAAGLASVGGVALGNLGNAVGASIGLAALFAVSAWAFTIVKYAGAAYLVWLGAQALRAPPAAAADAPLVRIDPRRIFRDGFVVALLNPKTAMFFVAFLPQFMGPGPATAMQSVVLGAIFVLIAAATDTAYALAAGAAAPLLARSGRLQRATRYVTGGTFIGLGILAALTGSRQATK